MCCYDLLDRMVALSSNINLRLQECDRLMSIDVCPMSLQASSYMKSDRQTAGRLSG